MDVLSSLPLQIRDRNWINLTLLIRKEKKEQIYSIHLNTLRLISWALQTSSHLDLTRRWQKLYSKQDFFLQDIGQKVLPSTGAITIMDSAFSNIVWRKGLSRMKSTFWFTATPTTKLRRMLAYQACLPSIIAATQLMVQRYLKNCFTWHRIGVFPSTV